MKNINGLYLIIVSLSQVSVFQINKFLFIWSFLFSTLGNWYNVFEKWSAAVSTIRFNNDSQIYKTFGYTLKNRKVNVLLTTYDHLIKDKALLSKMK